MTTNSTLNNIFSNCESLLSLPDISKWDTYNVNNMGYMFSNCQLLSSLPDISKWRVDKVIDISFFYLIVNL